MAEPDLTGKVLQELSVRNKSRQGKPWEIEADPKLKIEGSVNSFTKRKPLPEIRGDFKGMLREMHHKELKEDEQVVENGKDEESLVEEEEVQTLEVQLRNRAIELGTKEYEEKRTEAEFLVIDPHSGHVARPATTANATRSPVLRPESVPLAATAADRRKNSMDTYGEPWTVKPPSSPGLKGVDDTSRKRRQSLSQEVAMDMIANATDEANINAILKRSDVDVVSAEFQL